MATPQRSHATPEFRHLRQGRVLLSAGPPDMIGAGPENGGSTMHALCRMAAVCLAVLPLCALAEGGGYWPEGRKAAVSLAYDDALDSQLDNAVPALARHGFKATFYVPPGQGTLDARLDEWRAVAQAGHELGNHSLFHQCDGARPGRDWVVPHRDLHTTTVAQMHDQIQVANTFLRALDGRSERSFTSPCGDRLAADGDYVQALRDVFVAIKVSQGAHEAASMADFDRFAVPIIAPEGVSGRELIAMVEEAGRRGTVAAFTFHGIGGDYMSVSVQAHEELLAWLAEHRDEYWVAPMADIGAWVRDHPPSP